MNSPEHQGRCEQRRSSSDTAHDAGTAAAAARASPATTSRASTSRRGGGRALFFRSRLQLRRIRWSSNYHIKPPTKCCHTLAPVPEEDEEDADAEACIAGPSSAPASTATQSCSSCALCTKSLLRTYAFTDALPCRARPSRAATSHAAPPPLRNDYFEGSFG